MMMYLRQQMILICTFLFDLNISSQNHLWWWYESIWWIYNFGWVLLIGVMVEQKYLQKQEVESFKDFATVRLVNITASS